jgi:hypothetical protein
MSSMFLVAVLACEVPGACPGYAYNAPCIGILLPCPPAGPIGPTPPCPRFTWSLPTLPTPPCPRFSWSLPTLPPLPIPPAAPCIHLQPCWSYQGGW